MIEKKHIPTAVIYLCLLFLGVLAGCVPSVSPEFDQVTVPEITRTVQTETAYDNDCLGRTIETPEGAAITELSTSLTPIEKQIADADLIVLGTIAEISGTCYNQDGGEYYYNALPYFEIRLTVEEYLKQTITVNAPELILTTVGYGVSASVESPYAVGDQVLAFIVDRELAWKGPTLRPILRPFDDVASSVLLFQPDGTFVSIGGLHTPITLEEIRGQIMGEAEPGEPVPGCSAGGVGVFTPDDVSCYLNKFDPQLVKALFEDTSVLFTTPEGTSEWVGGAIIYHVPSVSSLVLDRNGDVDPSFSHINNRAALVAFNRLAANPALMAELKQTVQQHWQTSDSGEPVVRLSVAWQDGANTVFAVALAGLPADDERFYCFSESWTVGDEQIELVSECMARDAGTLVPHLHFITREVLGRQPLKVQVALDGVTSNDLRLAQGEVSVETAVYQSAIQYQNGRAVVLRNETTTDLPNAGQALDGAIAPPMLQTFFDVNQTSSSLDFLFHNSNFIFRQPGWVVERDYLPPTRSTPDCNRFQDEYPGLAGGVITLSQIGFSADGQQAVLYLKRECGAVGLASSYFLLALADGKWQVVGEFGKVEIKATVPLLPELVYRGQPRGCGDIFVYQANSESQASEYLVVGINIRAFSPSAEPIQIELADFPYDVVVKVDLFGDRVYNFGEIPYCNDVSSVALPQSVWLAESGLVTVTIQGTVPEESCSGEGYEVTILLQNVLFRSGEETAVLDEQLLENVAVGWCAG